MKMVKRRRLPIISTVVGISGLLVIVFSADIRLVLFGAKDAIGTVTIKDRDEGSSNRGPNLSFSFEEQISMVKNVTVGDGTVGSKDWANDQSSDKSSNSSINEEMPVIKKAPVSNGTVGAMTSQDIISETSNTSATDANEEEGVQMTKGASEGNGTVGVMTNQDRSDEKSNTSAVDDGDSIQSATVDETAERSVITDIQKHNLDVYNEYQIQAESPLYDHTIPWDDQIERPWMIEGFSPEPPYMLLLTNYGWNHPNQSYGMELYRGNRTRQLVDGIVNHPYFHPTAWEDIEAGNMKISNTTRYYVFIDRETCRDKNYPRYGHGDIVNADTDYGRGLVGRILDVWTGIEILHKSTLMQNAAHAQLVVFECNGWGPRSMFEQLRKIDLGQANQQQQQQQRTAQKPKQLLTYVSLSNTMKNAQPQDIGLLPPACRYFEMTRAQLDAIERCDDEKNRPLLLSFTGQVSRSQARKDLRGLHNNKDILIGKNNLGEVFEWMNETDPGIAFQKLASLSKFAATPLGDNLFSYRFTEVIQLGSIPVVYADDWLLPFGIELFDWREVAVVIPEQNANQTVEILNEISDRQRCVMRQKLVQLYQKYMATGPKVIAGILETMERRATKKWSRAGSIGSTNPTEDLEIPLEQQDASPLFDKTLTWKPDVSHEWVERSLSGGDKEPPYMLILSNTGWNDPNQQSGLQWYRSVFSRQLLEAIVNHKWFHPTAYWDFLQQQQQQSNSTALLSSLSSSFSDRSPRIYIFLDGETCGYFVSHDDTGPMSQPDRVGKRTSDRGVMRDGLLRKRVIRLLAPLNISWQLVYLDCEADGPSELVRPTQRKDNEGGDSYPQDNLAVISLSAKKSRAYLPLDQGLPFPPNRKFELSPSEEEAVLRSCQSRNIMLGFSGRMETFVRKTLQSLHNGQDVLIGEPSQMKKLMNESDPYFSLLSRSSFGAVPRGGDKLGTGRLVEVMSAGAIPVIYADDWLLPLHHVVDWNRIAVLIPERRADQSLDILRNLTHEQVCTLRKDMYSAYQQYFKTPELMIKGVVEGLELANDNLKKINGTVLAEET